MRVNISINNVLLKEVNSYCADMGYNRSALISELLRNKIGIMPKTAVEVKATPKIIASVEEKLEANRAIKRPTIPSIKGVVKGANQCKHGSMIGLCKYGC